MSQSGPSAGEPAEHRRFHGYLHALGQVRDAGEAGLVAPILADPDQAMAQSAVASHIDRRAAALCLGSAYEPWAQSMTRTTSGYPFLEQRLREWTLFRAITLGLPWHPDALTESSDWLQRKTAAASSPDALALLAEHGRTRKIRNAAQSNAQDPGPR
jgi:hypothetical protein